MRLDTRSGVGSWVLTGALMGILAGVVFIIFEMVVTGITGPSPFAPVQMIGAIGLGKGALPPMGGMHPTVGAPTAIIVGYIIHFILSAIFGLIFGVIVRLIRPLAANRAILVLAASIYGIALWIVNFYVIAPFAFPWFAMANPVVQFFAHTFFFGTALGLLLSIRVHQAGVAVRHQSGGGRTA